MTFVPRPNPAGDTLVSSRDQIRNNFQITLDRFAEDHVEFNVGTNAGYHKWARFPEQATGGGDDQVPTAVANITTLYAKDGTYANLHLQSEGGQEFQLTTLSATGDTNVDSFGANAYDPPVANHTGGWTFLPGGLILMYARVDTAVGNTAQFPFAFPSGAAPYSLTVTTENTTTARAVSVSNITASQFDFVISSGAVTAIHFMAIGK